MRDLPAVRLILMNYFKSSEICKDSGKLVMDSYSSPFGNVVIMCGSQGLVGVLFGKQFELFSDEIAENFKKIRNRARKFKLQSKKSVKNCLYVNTLNVALNFLGYRLKIIIVELIQSSILILIVNLSNIFDLFYHLLFLFHFQELLHG